MTIKMNGGVLETKPSSLFCRRLMQNTGVWLAVLFVHIFLWIVFNNERDMSLSHRSKPGYLSVILITLKDSVHVSRRVVSGSEDLPKISTASPKLMPKKLQHPKEMIGPKRSSLQSQDDNFPKPIPELDFDEMKRAALAVTHEPWKRLLPGIDRKISKAQKFADAIDHAKRGDCRSEYAYIGILAIPLLLKDTLTGEGCKW